MAGMKEKEILDRFGKPDFESASGSMWYFKHMIYVRNRSGKNMSIKLLRIKKKVFEWFDEEKDVWKMTPMQKRPSEAYEKFLDKQIEEILLDAPQ